MQFLKDATASVVVPRDPLVIQTWQTLVAGGLLLFTAQTLSQLKIATALDVVTLLALLIASIMYLAMAAVEQNPIWDTLHTIKWIVAFSLITQTFQSYLLSRSSSTHKQNLFGLLVLIGLAFYLAFLGSKKSSWSPLIWMGLIVFVAFFILETIQINDADIPAPNKTFSIGLFALMFAYFFLFLVNGQTLAPFAYGILDLLTIGLFTFLISFKFDAGPLI